MSEALQYLAGGKCASYRFLTRTPIEAFYRRARRHAYPNALTIMLVSSSRGVDDRNRPSALSWVRHQYRSSRDSYFQVKFQRSHTVSGFCWCSEGRTAKYIGNSLVGWSALPWYADDGLMSPARRRTFFCIQLSPMLHLSSYGGQCGAGEFRAMAFGGHGTQGFCRQAALHSPRRQHRARSRCSRRSAQQSRQANPTARALQRHRRALFLAFCRSKDVVAATSTDIRRQ